ncbi:MAG: hypothetical protein HC840_00915 [Leptolyngbyaceae cyanobacterium RM2_2_4]|nr:hypothetical protein [Leptolyngbyaceae cyanobacterium RM2_2_4]
MTDPNIVILIYRLGREIIKIKDHFEKLEPKIQELEKMGIECALFPASKENEIRSILTKMGGKRQIPN